MDYDACSISRILDTDDVTFEVGKFFSEVSSPQIWDLKIDSSVDSCLAVQDLDGKFTLGVRNMIVGERGAVPLYFNATGVKDEDVQIEHAFDVPPMTEDLEEGEDLLPDDHLERLLAYLAAKAVLKSSSSRAVDVLTSGYPASQKCSSDLISTHGFITSYDSFVVTEDDRTS